FVNGTRVKILTARDHASPGRHVLTEPPSERHASKDRNPTTSPVCKPPSPQSSEIHRKSTTASARIKEKARPNLHPGAQNPIDLETSIYALKYIKRLRSNQKSTRIFRTRVDWTKEKQKRRSRTDSGSNRRRSRRKDGAIRATAFPETIAGEIRCC
ncbi:unnamed protein product, partial [Brassica rapa subsp. narinosa]